MKPISPDTVGRFQRQIVSEYSNFISAPILSRAVGILDKVQLGCKTWVDIYDNLEKVKSKSCSANVAREMFDDLCIMIAVEIGIIKNKELRQYLNETSGSME